MKFTLDLVEKLFKNSITLESYEDNEPEYLYHKSSKEILELFESGVSIKVWKIDLYGTISYNSYIQFHSWDFEPIGFNRTSNLEDMVHKLNETMDTYQNN